MTTVFRRCCFFQEASGIAGNVPATGCLGVGRSAVCWAFGGWLAAAVLLWPVAVWPPPLRGFSLPNSVSYCVPLALGHGLYACCLGVVAGGWPGRFSFVSLLFLVFLIVAGVWPSMFGVLEQMRLGFANHMFFWARLQCWC